MNGSAHFIDLLVDLRVSDRGVERVTLGPLVPGIDARPHFDRAVDF